MNAEQLNKLIVVDATNYLFRAYHAIQDLRTRDGMPTNAIYGLTNSLILLRDKYADAVIACVFDAKGKTFRHAIYPAYKATRKKTDPELLEQIEPAKDIVRALGLSLYCVPKVEADDVIATLTMQGLHAKKEVFVASSDKDLTYLISKGCKMINPRDNSIVGAKEILVKYGVKPELMIDYLSLIGDSVDNVPGVPSVGPKTASKWLNEYKNLDGVVKNKDKIDGKVGEKFRESLEQLKLSKQLIILKEDVEITPHAANLTEPKPDVKLINKLCDKFKFSNQIKARMLKDAEDEVKAVEKVNVDVIKTEKEFSAAWKFLDGINRIGIHIETLDGDAKSIDPVSITLFTGKRGFYINFYNESASNKKAAYKFITKVFNNEKLNICSANLKQLLHVVKNEKLSIKAKLDDAILMAFCLDSTSSRNLTSIARRYLDYQVVSKDEVIGGRDKPKHFSELEIDQAKELTVQWAKAAMDLRVLVGRQLDATSLKLYKEIELPVINVLVDMEQNGILLDTKELNSITKELSARMKSLEGKIAKITKTEINLNSPKKLSELLYDQLKLDEGKKTKGGARSTDESELQRLTLTGKSEVPELVLAYRHANKLVNTYTDVLPNSLNKTTKRLHTKYIQIGANTGRLASVDPNLQNIPVRTLDGQRIRKCFIASKNNVLLSADYSQIELRILAHFSKDKTLLQAFANHEDVHQRTAAEIFDIDPIKVNAEQRRFAKTINFGLIYGMGAFGLAQRINISRKEATELINNYFARLPEVKNYLEEVKKEASEKKYIMTHYGRRINVEPRTNQPAARAGSMRAAINAPMQGTAADIMKLAMTATKKYLDKNKLKSLILLQVHDELVLEVPKGEVKKLSKELPKVMQSVSDLSVPLEVNLSTGKNWDEAH